MLTAGRRQLGLVQDRCLESSLAEQEEGTSRLATWSMGFVDRWERCDRSTGNRRTGIFVSRRIGLRENALQRGIVTD